MSAGPVWIDGSFTGAIDPFDRGLLLGDGVFDTLVAFNRVPFAGDPHLERLKSHAEAIGIALDPSRVRTGWKAVLAASDADHMILRTTVTRGVAGRGLWPRTLPSPTLIVSAVPWNAELYGQPARLVTSAILRNPSSPASRLKTLAYLDNVLAAREAAERDCDDALFLNPAGRIASTTIANVFAVYGERIATPPARDGAMPGVMRTIVLEGARRLGFDAAEGAIEPADVRTADAVFITNSVRFLRPVVSLDGHPISTAGAPILAAIANAVAGEVRRKCSFDLPALAPPFGPEIASAKVEGPEAGRAGAAP